MQTACCVKHELKHYVTKNNLKPNIIFVLHSEKNMLPSNDLFSDDTVTLEAFKILLKASRGCIVLWICKLPLYTCTSLSFDSVTDNGLKFCSLAFAECMINWLTRGTKSRVRISLLFDRWDKFTITKRFCQAPAPFTKMTVDVKAQTGCKTQLLNSFEPVQMSPFTNNFHCSKHPTHTPSHTHTHTHTSTHTHTLSAPQQRFTRSLPYRPHNLQQQQQLRQQQQPRLRPNLRPPKPIFVRPFSRSFVLPLRCAIGPPTKWVSTC